MKEVLRAATVAFGGVHLMTPSQQRDQDVAGTLRMLGNGDVADIAKLVQEIGAVTVEALTPVLN